MTVTKKTMTMMREIAMLIMMAGMANLRKITKQFRHLRWTITFPSLITMLLLSTWTVEITRLRKPKRPTDSSEIKLPRIQ